MRFPGMVLTLCALAACAAPSARAGMLARSADPVRPEPTYNLLPAGDNVSPAALLDAARRLPAAQIALQQLAAAGYTRAPEADVVKLNGPHACVTLGFYDAAHPARAALVIVTSDLESVPQQSTIAAMVLDVDLATGHVELAPDVPPGVECIAYVTDGGSTLPVSYVTDAGRIRAGLVRWLQCAALGCGGGGAGCVIVGTMVGPLAPPAIAGCTVAVCAVASFLCLL